MFLFTFCLLQIFIFRTIFRILDFFEMKYFWIFIIFVFILVQNVYPQEIECVVNCNPTFREKETVLSFVCENCSISSTTFKWYTVPPIDEANYTLENEGYQLNIKPMVMDVDTNLAVTVQTIVGEEVLGEINLHFVVLVKPDQISEQIFGAGEYSLPTLLKEMKYEDFMHGSLLIIDEIVNQPDESFVTHFLKHITQTMSDSAHLFSDKQLFNFFDSIPKLQNYTDTTMIFHLTKILEEAADKLIVSGGHHHQLRVALDLSHLISHTSAILSMFSNIKTTKFNNNKGGDYPAYDDYEPVLVEENRNLIKGT